MATELRERTLLTSKVWVHKFNERLAQLLELQNEANSPSGEKHVHIKKMSDSFVQVFLPFWSDPSLKEEYLSHFGYIRMGKVLEDMDALAGYISFLHGVGGERLLTCVTASVDRIDLLRQIPTDLDLTLSGCVTYVGRSSMEVSITMESILQDSGFTVEEMESVKYMRTKLPRDMVSGELILSAKFTMVSIDSETSRPAPTAQLRLDTEEERALFKAGEEHKLRKQLANFASLSVKPPNNGEMALVHNLYKEYKQYLDTAGRELAANPKPAHVSWMSDTSKQNVALTFPQDRNLNNKIFGGHLMRLAFEFGYATGALFSKRALRFLAIDDITFKRPVEIGAILDLTSTVVFTHDDKMVIKVTVHVVEVQEGGKHLSNEFWLTFEAVRKPEDTTEPRRVLPRSYDECMMLLEAKRRFEGV
ncbi:HotDog domain-containing protein [Chytriomyces sp. MP71]|nr:HotDog domain-containing protein [Chytriomyces sp. MP71]